jgi:hypothetical protein
MKTQLNVMSDLMRFQVGVERGHTKTCILAKWKEVRETQFNP